MALADLTWEQVRARSASKLGTLTTFCGDCWMQWEVGRTPCIRHTRPEEQDERSAIIAGLARRLNQSPIGSL